MLQFVDSVWIPVVVLALDAIMHLAPEVELPDGCRIVGQRVTAQGFFADLANADPLDLERAFP